MDTFRPSPRTDWTRFVPPPVLTGHVSFLPRRRAGRYAGTQVFLGGTRQVRVPELCVRCGRCEPARRGFPAIGVCVCVYMCVCVCVRVCV